MSPAPQTIRMPLPVRLWQEAVHRPGIYDLKVDHLASALSSAAMRCGGLAIEISRLA